MAIPHFGLLRPAARRDFSPLWLVFSIFGCALLVGINVGNEAWSAVLGWIAALLASAGWLHERGRR